MERKKMKQIRKPQKIAHEHDNHYNFIFDLNFDFMAIYCYDKCTKRQCKNYTKDFHWYEIYLNNFVDPDDGEFNEDLFYMVMTHEYLHEALRLEDMDLETEHIIIENMLGMLIE